MSPLIYPRATAYLAAHDISQHILTTVKTIGVTGQASGRGAGPACHVTGLFECFEEAAAHHPRRGQRPGLRRQ